MTLLLPLSLLRVDPLRLKQQLTTAGTVGNSSNSGTGAVSNGSPHRVSQPIPPTLPAPLLTRLSQFRSHAAQVSQLAEQFQAWQHSYERYVTQLQDLSGTLTVLCTASRADSSAVAPPYTPPPSLLEHQQSFLRSASTTFGEPLDRLCSEMADIEQRVQDVEALQQLLADMQQQIAVYKQKGKTAQVNELTEELKETREDYSFSCNKLLYVCDVFELHKHELLSGEFRQFCAAHLQMYQQCSHSVMSSLESYQEQTAAAVQEEAATDANNTFELNQWLDTQPTATAATDAAAGSSAATPPADASTAAVSGTALLPPPTDATSLSVTTSSPSPIASLLT